MKSYLFLKIRTGFHKHLLQLNCQVNLVEMFMNLMYTEGLPVLPSFDIQVQFICIQTTLEK
jgi:hypothetical protein